MPTVSLLMENQEVKTFEVAEGSVIYEALDDQGHQLPHGCLSGSCSSCKLVVLEGANNLEHPSFVENNTIKSVKDTHANAKDKEIRLACRAKIKGDIKIQPFK